MERLALIVTLHEVPEMVSQPSQLRVLEPMLAGAVRLTTTPTSYVSANGVVPEDWPLLSAGLAVICTLLLGFDDLTVSDVAVGGGEGGFTTKLAELDGPPPGAGLVTITAKLPAVS